MESTGLRILLRVWVGLVLAFLFVPIFVIVLYAFDSSIVQSWPIPHFTLHWFSVALNDPAVRQAFWLSVKVGLLACGIALVLGSSVSYALHNFAFFVVVYNNLIARLRRTPGSLAEASMDLGARGWQTQLYVMLPTVATALVSGGLLAFALSFDEVIVTLFTSGALNTLPIWIFGQIRAGQQLPEVNAVVSIVIVATIIPVLLAARLAGAGGVTRAGRAAVDAGRE